MPPVGFEPTISAGERPQTYALERAATGTGSVSPIYSVKKDGLMPNHEQTKGEIAPNYALFSMKQGTDITGSFYITKY